MNSDILVVYKKNFEGVHDIALKKMINCLDELKNDLSISSDYKARERVQKHDFEGRKSDFST